MKVEAGAADEQLILNDRATCVRGGRGDSDERKDWMRDRLAESRQGGSSLRHGGELSRQRAWRAEDQADEAR